MKVEIIDISDVSGSMQSLRESVISGFNSFLEEQKAVPGEAKFTQVQFNNNYYLMQAGVDIKEVQPLNNSTYFPNGTTALLDAIGRTLDSQGERINKENWADKVIVCIRTDGLENASIQYTQTRIKEMIEHAQKHNWVFIFAAANQDAFLTAQQYGIDPKYSQNVTATAAGIGQSYAVTGQTMRSLRTDK